MPEDLGKILFSKEEVQAAVVDNCLRVKILLPDKNIDDLEVRADTGPGDTKEVGPSRDRVAAALIRYCSSINVPLPRSAPWSYTGWTRGVRRRPRPARRRMAATTLYPRSSATTAA